MSSYRAPPASLAVEAEASTHETGSIGDVDERSVVHGYREVACRGLDADAIPLLRDEPALGLGQQRLLPALDGDEPHAVASGREVESARPAGEEVRVR